LFLLFDCKLNENINAIATENVVFNIFIKIYGRKKRFCFFYRQVCLTFVIRFGVMKLN